MVTKMGTVHIPAGSLSVLPLENECLTVFDSVVLVLYPYTYKDLVPELSPYGVRARGSSG